MTDADRGTLELALADLAGWVDFPPTPRLAAEVAGELRARGPRRAAGLFRRPLRRAFVLGLAAAVLLAGAAAALGLGLGGVLIRFGQPTLSPLPSDLAGLTRLGAVVSLDEARERAAFRIVVPRLSALGEPDQVRFGTPPPGGQVALVYGERPGYPTNPSSGVGLIVTQFAARPAVGTFEKMIDSGADVESVEVRGRRGYWIGGGEHFFAYLDADGRRVETTLRLVADTLLWEEGGVTYRIEGAPTLEAALEVATSLE
jgi:hypothetical protein